MEVRTLLPNVRRLYGEQANPLTDEDLILQFADIYEGDPIEDISDVVSLMENNAIREINSVSENSQLKNFRRLYGDQVAGTSDEDILYDYIQSENIDPETPLTDIVSDLEESASRGLYEEDVESFGNSVAQNDQIRQSISAIKEVAGDGSTLFQSENPYDDSDIDNVISFLKKEEDRGFIDKLKDDFVDKVTPLKGFTDLFKSAGQAISAFTQDNTGRSLEFAKLENAVSDPRVINRFVREAQRYVENPNLFSEEEKQNLISAAKIFETTSFNIDTSNPESIENFSSSAAKSILIQPISSLVTVAESGLENLGLDESFINDISRNLSFIDANVAESDSETMSGLAGGVAGSAVQSALLILSGAGPVAMAGVFGTQGAADNIETYRSFVESNGGDPNKAVENVVALGGAVISGTLGTLTGKGIESLPGVNKVIQGGQQALYKSALSEAFTSPASKENLFRIGKETFQTVFKNRKNASNAIKSYLRFAASTAPVEGFEEVSEEALNELLLNTVVEDFETDPEEFKRRLLISGIGGTIAGASFGPIQRAKIREDAKTLTDNFLGLDLIGPSNQEEAQVELDRLIQKENLYQSRFEGGQFPPAIEALISDHKNRLTGIINEDITPGEAYPDIQSSNSELSFGDVLLDPRLRDTPLYNAVEKDLTKKGTSKINDNQNKAYDAVIDYLDNSDLPETLTNFIKSKVYKTPISKVEGRRKGVTFTDTIHSIAGRKEKTFSGTYLTNDSDLDAAYDEVFHMINDSRSDQDLQNLVNSYNQVYGTNHSVDSYSTNQEVRDEIAKKATEIFLKKESLPEVDGEFKRTVEAFQNGNVLEINPDIGNVFELRNRVPITGQQLSDGMVNGDFRRVNDGSGRALFQDNKNDVYLLTETDGKQYISKIADGQFTDELPTLDARVVVSKTKLEEINNDFRIKRKVEPLRLTLIENDEVFDENWFVPNNLQLTQPFTRIEQGFNVDQTGNNRFDNRTSNQIEQSLNVDQPIEPVIVTSRLQVTKEDLAERTFRKFVNGPNNKILELDDENNVIGAFIRNQVGNTNSLESVESTELDKAYVNKFINVNDKGQRLLGDGKPVETSNEDLVNQLLQTLAEQGKDPISLLLQKRLKELKQQNRSIPNETLQRFIKGEFPREELFKLLGKSSFGQVQRKKITETPVINNEPNVAFDIPSIKNAVLDYHNKVNEEPLTEKPIVNLSQDDRLKIGEVWDSVSHNPNDNETIDSYKVFINETIDQFQFILNETGINVVPWIEDGPFPYNNAYDMLSDIRDNNRMYFYPTDTGFQTSQDVSDHIMLEPSGLNLNGYELLNNDIFRIVHDFYGHIAFKNEFDDKGEENAWAMHRTVYSSKAQKALFSETIAQSSRVFSNPSNKSSLNKFREAYILLANSETVEDGKALLNEAMESITYADQKMGLVSDDVIRFTESKLNNKILIDEATLEEVFKPEILNKLTDKEKAVVSKMLDETSEPDIFKIDGVHADSGLPLYQLNDKIAKSLKKKKIVVKGKALLGDVVTETLDNIVAFNPKSFKGEESDIPQESVETFIDFVRPKKSSKTFKTTEVRDDEDVVKIYSSPTSARNSIESEFEMEGDLEDGTFSIGGREFVFTNKTVVTDELLKDYYSQPMGDTTLGEVIQTYLDNIGNGSDRVALGKAVRKLSGRIVKSAKGQNVNIDQALEEVLDIVLGSEEEVITEIDYNSPEAKDTFRKLRQAVRRERLIV